MGLDQTIYAIKNGVIPLKDFYNYEDDEVDMLFHEGSEIIYWRKNFPIHHFLTWELKRPKILILIAVILRLQKKISII